MRARALSDRPHAQHEPQGADNAHQAAPEKDTPADTVALARIQDGTTHNTTTAAHDTNPLRASRITSGNTNNHKPRPRTPIPTLKPPQQNQNNKKENSKGNET